MGRGGEVVRRETIGLHSYDFRNKLYKIYKKIILTSVTTNFGEVKGG